MRKVSGVSKTLMIIIVVIIVAASFVGIYVAGLLHYGSVKLIGQCRDATYLVPDSVRIVLTNVTTVSNNTTSYYVSTSSILASTQKLGGGSYTTTTIAHNSSTFVITNTTNLTNYEPSAAWIASTCTFAP